MSILKLNNNLLKLNNQLLNLTSSPSQPTATDYDGNIYTSVTIGTQTWLTTNLKTTHYTDGTIIPNLTGTTDWSTDSTGAYCWYSNNEGTYKNLYGGLYNWLAATNAHGLAPTGWKVPSLSDYQTLGTYLGGASVASGYLKETGTTHWQSPNTGATNETGFTALPGGDRDINGAYNRIGTSGKWWCSDNTTAWYRDLEFNDAGVLRVSPNKKNGLSVRCIKD